MSLMRITAAAMLSVVTLTRAHGQAVDVPIQIVSPYQAGGIGGTIARMIAEHMNASFKRAVIVVNKPGAAGRIGVKAVKDSAPDGSVLLFTPIAPMAIFPHVYDKLDYDPVADFVPISQVATFDLAVAVGAKVPSKSLAELVAWLRANPNDATYGSPAAGSLPHFFAVLFAQATNVDLRHVAYKGNAQATVDLIGRHLPLLFTSTQDLVDTHKAGQLRVLATSGAQRSRVLPGVPTFSEAGYRISGEGWWGIYAPAKTSSQIAAQLNAAIVKAVNEQKVKDRLIALGLVPTGTSGPELARIQKADSDLWGPVVKASGFQAR